jgi:hypothetical protein
LLVCGRPLRAITAIARRPGRMQQDPAPGGGWRGSGRIPQHGEFAYDFTENAHDGPSRNRDLEHMTGGSSVDPARAVPAAGSDLTGSDTT